MGYYLFLLYTISFFFRLTERFPFLGSIRFELILGIALIIMSGYKLMLDGSTRQYPETNTSKILIAIIGYIVMTLPMVHWPGTVIKYGIPDFLKSSVFFLFAIAFVKEEAQLKKFVIVYMILLMIIVLEPLFYFFKDGSMGYKDYSMGEETFYRLSGTTNKVGGNPNGLASVVAITIPIVFFLFKYYRSKITKTLFFLYIPLSMVTLVLTGSRSGLLATAVAVTMCVMKSKVKIAGILIVSIIALAGWPYLGDVHKQRYLSIVDSTAQGRSGAEGRLAGIKDGFDMFLERPIFGYGLGTYKEANWHLKKETFVSHNLYIGVLVELGIIGFVIYFKYIYSLFQNIFKVKKIYQTVEGNNNFPITIANILEAVLITQLAFSFFAGGPSYYIWFLLGGISVATLSIADSNVAKCGIKWQTLPLNSF